MLNDISTRTIHAVLKNRYRLAASSEPQLSPKSVADPSADSGPVFNIFGEQVKLRGTRRTASERGKCFGSDSELSDRNESDRIISRNPGGQGIKLLFSSLMTRHNKFEGLPLETLFRGS
jgi:hypothetical protein